MPTTKGIMGWLDLNGAAGLSGIRVTSCGLKATQEVSAMDTVDGAYDTTAYRLGPVRVEGDVVFPIPVKNNKWETLLQLAVQRDNTTGKLSTAPFTVTAAYDHQIAYNYGDCVCNTYAVKIDSEEAVEVTMGLIGTNRTVSHKTVVAVNAPERVLTWNEVTVALGGGMTPSGPIPPSSDGTFSQYVRNFSFEINNNTTAFFALNGQIFVQSQNIVAGKREITGSMEVAWNGSGLTNHAFQSNTTPAYCGSDQYITVDLAANCGSSAPKQLKFWGIIYNMEEISMQNDFFMGTQSWRAYGHSSNEYKALSLGGTPY